MRTFRDIFTPPPFFFAFTQICSYLLLYIDFTYLHHHYNCTITKTHSPLLSPNQKYVQYHGIIVILHYLFLFFHILLTVTGYNPISLQRGVKLQPATTYFYFALLHNSSLKEHGLRLYQVISIKSSQRIEAEFCALCLGLSLLHENYNVRSR